MPNVSDHLKAGFGGLSLDADPLYGKDIREGRIPVVGPESLRKR